MEGKWRYTVPAPTPARSAMAPSGAMPPSAANEALAAASTRALFRRASAREGSPSGGGPPGGGPSPSAAPCAASLAISVHIPLIDKRVSRSGTLTGLLVPILLGSLPP
ncbi:hypothetical protein GCM10009574_014690 [Streptomyces asiaticus]|uniref:Uncharacterized protein n=2 Tax=Streptomyces rhizosphaericus TaxID=114699 RepID=A0ABN1QWD6_9ACTN